MNPKLAEKMQNEIFKKMPVEKKIKLAFDFSLFCLNLNKSNQNGNRKSPDKSGKNIRRP